MIPSPKELVAQVRECPLWERRRLESRLRRALQGLREAPQEPGAIRSVREVAGHIERARQAAARRRGLVPRFTYPDDLPIAQRRDEIRELVAAHQVVVVCGETGSGKTTQLPKICLELGRGVVGAIGHTQPRRIAARSVAARLSQELGVVLGGVVGAKVRFSDATSADTLIKVMTDGVLLAETQSDRLLERYDTIIIDEAHERSLNIDFLLGYLKRLLPQRPELKVIITSATIDPGRFSDHFGGAPIVSVAGRTYPVEVRYRPPGEVSEDDRDEHQAQHLLDAVDECVAHGAGDILVFLSGEREIREASERLANHRTPSGGPLKLLPLYGRLSMEEQAEVFRPHVGRRVVLSTNVAETSLTVPGIRYVIDTGQARVSRYSTRTRVQRLEVEAISRASADQRAGRCGRTGPGVCVRLYAQDDYVARPRETDPEILRTPLASVILQMISLGLGRPEDFPFMDAPDARMIKDGTDTLVELGALTPGGALTTLGREMASLPIDPHIARMLLAARGEPGSCLADVLVIAAALSVRDPRDRPLDKQGAADMAHLAFRDPRGDFAGFLRLWDWYQDRKRHLSGSKLRQACRASFVSFVRMREWEDIHHQLADMMGSLPVRDGPTRVQPAPRRGAAPPRAKRHGTLTARPPLGPVPNPDESGEVDRALAEQERARLDAMHRAILPGVLANVGLKGELGEYRGVRGLKFRVFPGSVFFKAGPRWIMAAEVVRTSSMYARTVAPVEPDWIERAAMHMVSRSHSDPHWDAKTGRVMAFERVSLLGLELASRRRVHYGPIDTPTSREIFILHALVKGEMVTQGEFFGHNLRLVASLRELEVRARRPGLFADEHRMFAFYAARVPAPVCTRAQFEAWLHSAPARVKQGLCMTPEELRDPGVELPGPDEFPDALVSDGLVLPLEYRHTPGTPDDGMTLRVPVEALGQLPDTRLAWGVPGLLSERIDAMLRGLPKDVRKQLPTGDVAAVIARSLKFGDGAAPQKVSDWLSRHAGLDVPRATLERAPMPDLLTFRLEVLDKDGRTVASGRDAGAVRAAVAGLQRPGASGIVVAGPERFQKDSLVSWDFGDLPERVELDRFGTRFVTFPGLIDKGASVSLRLFDHASNAVRETRGGLRRLFCIEAAEELRRLTHRHPDLERLAVLAATLGPASAFRAAMTELTVDLALQGERPPPRTQDQYRARVREALARLTASLRQATALVEPVLKGYQPVAQRLGAAHPAAWADSIADIRGQLALLLPADFPIKTPREWLMHVPRFLAAIDRRLDRLGGQGIHKDRERLVELTPIWLGVHELVKRQRELGLASEQIAEYRWLVEELRVSMFAQDLGTSTSVSVKRLHDKWAEVLAP